MFNPTSLDPIVKSLRRDADELRKRKTNLRKSIDSIPWDGARADRFRSRISHRAEAYDKRATDLLRIADQVVSLKAEVERELRYLREIERRFRQFISDAQRAAHAALNAAQHALHGAEKALEVAVDVVTGDLDEAKRDFHAAESQFNQAMNVLSGLEQKHSSVPTGDPRWRHADSDARRQSGSREVYCANYSVPAR